MRIIKQPNGKYKLQGKDDQEYNSPIEAKQAWIQKQLIKVKDAIATIHRKRNS